MNTNNLDDSQKQFIGPTARGAAYTPPSPATYIETPKSMPEEPEVGKIVNIILEPNGDAYDKAVLIDRHYRQKYLKVALECVGEDEEVNSTKMLEFEKPVLDSDDDIYAHIRNLLRAEIRAALKEAFKWEGK